MIKQGFFLACNTAVALSAVFSSLHASDTVELSGYPYLKQRSKTHPSEEVTPAGGCSACQARKKPPIPAHIMLTGCQYARVESQALPPGQEQKLYGKMAKQAEKNKLAVAKLSGTKRLPSNPRKLGIQTKDCFFSNSIKFPAASHVVQEIDPAGTMVSIEDGSAFTVAEADQKEVRSWGINALITIKPAPLGLWNKLTGSAPQYKYRLVNLSRKGKAVSANLALGPFKDSLATRVITAVDPLTGTVFLNNGAEYQVDLDGPCAKIFQGWKIGHSVITGTNDTWFSLGSPFILINVDKNNWIPATRVS